MVTVKVNKIDSSMASTFLGISAEKCPQSLCRSSGELLAEIREMRQPREADLFENTGHLTDGN